jgi:hypothetical protein
LAERLGSGDGERKTWLTPQMPYEPLPASVLFGFSFVIGLLCYLRLKGMISSISPVAFWDIPELVFFQVSILFSEVLITTVSLSGN